MKGNLYIIIGFTGTGKSTFVKRVTEGKNMIVFDINNEWNLPELKQIIPTTGRYRYTGTDFKMFLDYIEQDGQKMLKNFDVVFEDCTGFLQGRLKERFLQIIQAKRHANNNYYFLFHGIDRVPPALMTFCNNIVLFKTNDNPSVIKRKYPNLLKHYYTLKASPNKYEKKILNVQ